MRKFEIRDYERSSQVKRSVGAEHEPNDRSESELMGESLQFWKVQSIGNDFPLIHLADFAVPPESMDFEIARLAAIICDRRFAVGGDGLLAVGQTDDGIVLRMFNPDGTEDFCGNGLRCAADHVHRLGWVQNAFTIRHLGVDVPCRIENGHVFTTLPPATYDPERVPVVGGEQFNTEVWSGVDGGTPLSLHGSVLSTGTTHTIIPTFALPDDESFRSVSAKIEIDPKFPMRTSIMWSREVSENVLELKIWERGVGETMGCGSGSSAAAVDYLRRKGRGGTVEVRNPGGSLILRLKSWDAPIEVEGVARAVYSGRWAQDRY